MASETSLADEYVVIVETANGPEAWFEGEEPLDALILARMTFGVYCKLRQAAFAVAVADAKL